jgi:hypothetical protein
MRPLEQIVFVRNEDSVYLGQEVAGVRSGKGMLRMINGDAYTGEFKDGLYHGHGELKRAKEVYRGMFVEGVKEGLGRQISNSKTYTGYFKNNKKDGVAIAQIDNGNQVVKGNYVKGELLGFGILDINDSDTGQRVFTGYFKNSRLNDIGMEQCRDYTYIGQLQDNKRFGLGMMQKTDGSKYQGGWEKDLKHGFGKEQLPSGDLYEGTFEYGVKTGQGRSYAKDKDVKFTGTFENGLKTGFGKMTFRDGTFMGSFKKNQRNGLGLQRTSEEEYYLGYWLNDKREGIGLLKAPNKEYIGEWQNGELRGNAILTEADNKKKAVNLEEGGRCTILPEDQIPILLAKFGSLDIETFMQTSNHRINDIEEYINRSVEQVEKKLDVIQARFQAEHSKLQNDIDLLGKNARDSEGELQYVIQMIETMATQKGPEFSQVFTMPYVSLLNMKFDRTEHGNLPRVYPELSVGPPTRPTLVQSTYEDYRRTRTPEQLMQEPTRGQYNELDDRIKKIMQEADKLGIDAANLQRTVWRVKNGTVEAVVLSDNPSLALQNLNLDDAHFKNSLEPLRSTVMQLYGDSQKARGNVVNSKRHESDNALLEVEKLRAEIDKLRTQTERAKIEEFRGLSRPEIIDGIRLETSKWRREMLKMRDSTNRQKSDEITFMRAQAERLRAEADKLKMDESNKVTGGQIDQVMVQLLRFKAESDEMKADEFDKVTRNIEAPYTGADKPIDQLSAELEWMVVQTNQLKEDRMRMVTDTYKAKKFRELEVLEYDLQKIYSEVERIKSEELRRVKVQEIDNLSSKVDGLKSETSILEMEPGLTPVRQRDLAKVKSEVDRIVAVIEKMRQEDSSKLKHDEVSRIKAQLEKLRVESAWISSEDPKRVRLEEVDRILMKLTRLKEQIENLQNMDSEKLKNFGIVDLLRTQLGKMKEDEADQFKMEIDRLKREEADRMKTELGKIRSIAEVIREECESMKCEAALTLRVEAFKVKSEAERMLLDGRTNPEEVDKLRVQLERMKQETEQTRITEAERARKAEELERVKEELDSIRIAAEEIKAICDNIKHEGAVDIKIAATTLRADADRMRVEGPKKPQDMDRMRTDLEKLKFNVERLKREDIQRTANELTKTKSELDELKNQIGELSDEDLADELTQGIRKLANSADAMTRTDNMKRETLEKIKSETMKLRNVLTSAKKRRKDDDDLENIRSPERKSSRSPKKIVRSEDRGEDAEKARFELETIRQGAEKIIREMSASRHESAGDVQLNASQLRIESERLRQSADRLGPGVLIKVREYYEKLRIVAENVKGDELEREKRAVVERALQEIERVKKEESARASSLVERLKAEEIERAKSELDRLRLQADRIRQEVEPIKTELARQLVHDSDRISRDIDRLKIDVAKKPEDVTRARDWVDGLNNTLERVRREEVEAKYKEEFERIRKEGEEKVQTSILRQKAEEENRLRGELESLRGRLSKLRTIVEKSKFPAVTSMRGEIDRLSNTIDRYKRDGIRREDVDPLVVMVDRLRIEVEEGDRQEGEKLRNEMELKLSKLQSEKRDWDEDRTKLDQKERTARTELETLRTELERIKSEDGYWRPECERVKKELEKLRHEDSKRERAMIDGLRAEWDRLRSEIEAVPIEIPSSIRSGLTRIRQEIDRIRGSDGVDRVREGMERVRTEWAEWRADEGKRKGKEIEDREKRVGDAVEKMREEVAEAKAEIDRTKADFRSMSLRELDYLRKIIERMGTETEGRRSESGVRVRVMVERLRGEIDRLRSEGVKMRVEDVERVRGEVERAREEMERVREEEVRRGVEQEEREKMQTLVDKVRISLDRLRGEMETGEGMAGTLGVTLRGRLEKVRSEVERLRSEGVKRVEEVETIREEMERIRGEVERVRIEEKDKTHRVEMEKFKTEERERTVAERAREKDREAEKVLAEVDRLKAMCKKAKTDIEGFTVDRAIDLKAKLASLYIEVDRSRDVRKSAWTWEDVCRWRDTWGEVISEIERVRTDEIALQRERELSRREDPNSEKPRPEILILREAIDGLRTMASKLWVGEDIKAIDRVAQDLDKLGPRPSQESIDRVNRDITRLRSEYMDRIIEDVSRLRGVEKSVNEQKNIEIDRMRAEIGKVREEYEKLMTAGGSRLRDECIEMRDRLDGIRVDIERTGGENNIELRIQTIKVLDNLNDIITKGPKSSEEVDKIRKSAREIEQTYTRTLTTQVTSFNSKHQSTLSTITDLSRSILSSISEEIGWWGIEDKNIRSNLEKVKGMVENRGYRPGQNEDVDKVRLDLNTLITEWDRLKREEITTMRKTSVNRENELKGEIARLNGVVTSVQTAEEKRKEKIRAGHESTISGLMTLLSSLQNSMENSSVQSKESIIFTISQLKEQINNTRNTEDQERRGEEIDRIRVQYNRTLEDTIKSILADTNSVHKSLQSAVSTEQYNNIMRELNRLQGDNPPGVIVREIERVKREAEGYRNRRVSDMSTLYADLDNLHSLKSKHQQEEREARTRLEMDRQKKEMEMLAREVDGLGRVVRDEGLGKSEGLDRVAEGVRNEIERCGRGGEWSAESTERIRTSVKELHGRIEAVRIASLQAASVESQSKIATLNENIQKIQATLDNKGNELANVQKGMQGIINGEIEFYTAEIDRITKEIAPLKSESAMNLRIVLMQLAAEIEKTKIAMSSPSPNNALNLQPLHNQYSQCVINLSSVRKDEWERSVRLADTHRLRHSLDRIRSGADRLRADLSSLPSGSTGNVLSECTTLIMHCEEVARQSSLDGSQIEEMMTTLDKLRSEAEKCIKAAEEDRRLKSIETIRQEEREKLKSEIEKLKDLDSLRMMEDIDRIRLICDNLLIDISTVQHERSADTKIALLTLRGDVESVRARGVSREGGKEVEKIRSEVEKIRVAILTMKVELEERKRIGTSAEKLAIELDSLKSQVDDLSRTCDSITNDRSNSFRKEINGIREDIFRLKSEGKVTLDRIVDIRKSVEELRKGVEALKIDDIDQRKKAEYEKLSAVSEEKLREEVQRFRKAEQERCSKELEKLKATYEAAGKELDLIQVTSDNTKQVELLRKSLENSKSLFDLASDDGKSLEGIDRMKSSLEKITSKLSQLRSEEKSKSEKLAEEFKKKSELERMKLQLEEDKKNLAGIKHPDVDYCTSSCTKLLTEVEEILTKGGKSFEEVDRVKVSCEKIRSECLRIRKEYCDKVIKEDQISGANRGAEVDSLRKDIESLQSELKRREREERERLRVDIGAIKTESSSVYRVIQGSQHTEAGKAKSEYEYIQQATDRLLSDSSLRQEDLTKLSSSLASFRELAHKISLEDNNQKFQTTEQRRLRSQLDTQMKELAETRSAALKLPSAHSGSLLSSVDTIYTKIADQLSSQTIQLDAMLSVQSEMADLHRAVMNAKDRVREEEIKGWADGEKEARIKSEAERIKAQWLFVRYQFESLGGSADKIRMVEDMGKKIFADKNVGFKEIEEWKDAIEEIRAEGERIRAEESSQRIKEKIEMMTREEKLRMVREVERFKLTDAERMRADIVRVRRTCKRAKIEVADMPAELVEKVKENIEKVAEEADRLWQRETTESDEIEKLKDSMDKVREEIDRIRHEEIMKIKLEGLDKVRAEETLQLQKEKERLKKLEAEMVLAELAKVKNNIGELEKTISDCNSQGVDQVKAELQKFEQKIKDLMISGHPSQDDLDAAKRTFDVLKLDADRKKLEEKQAAQRIIETEKMKQEIIKIKEESAKIMPEIEKIDHLKVLQVKAWISSLDRKCDLQATQKELNAADVEPLKEELKRLVAESENIKYEESERIRIEKEQELARASEAVRLRAEVARLTQEASKLRHAEISRLEKDIQAVQQLAETAQNELNELDSPEAIALHSEMTTLRTQSQKLSAAEGSQPEEVASTRAGLQKLRAEMDRIRHERAEKTSFERQKLKGELEKIKADEQKKLRHETDEVAKRCQELETLIRQRKEVEMAGLSQKVEKVRGDVKKISLKDELENHAVEEQKESIKEIAKMFEDFISQIQKEEEQNMYRGQLISIVKLANEERQKLNEISEQSLLNKITPDVDKLIADATALKESKLISPENVLLADQRLNSLKKEIDRLNLEEKERVRQIEELQNAKKTAETALAQEIQKLQQETELLKKTEEEALTNELNKILATSEDLSSQLPSIKQHEMFKELEDSILSTLEESKGMMKRIGKTKIGEVSPLRDKLEKDKVGVEKAKIELADRERLKATEIELEAARKAKQEEEDRLKKEVELNKEAARQQEEEVKKLKALLEQVQGMEQARLAVEKAKAEQQLQIIMGEILNLTNLEGIEEIKKEADEVHSQTKRISINDGLTQEKIEPLNSSISKIGKKLEDAKRNNEKKRLDDEMKRIAELEKEKADLELKERVAKEMALKLQVEKEEKLRLEAKQKEEAEAARLKAEIEAKEKAEKEAIEKVQRELKEKAEREARENAEKELREKAEKEAKERELKEAKEREEREARERAEKEAREKAEAEAALLRAELEAKKKAEAEAEAARVLKEKLDKEKADAEVARLLAEKLQKEKEEQEAARIKAEKEEKERQEQERLRLEKEAKDKAAEEERKKKLEEELAKQKAEQDELRLKAEKEAKDKAEKEAKEKAHREAEEARIKKEKEAREKAEAEAKAFAENESIGKSLQAHKASTKEMIDSAQSIQHEKIDEVKKALEDILKTIDTSLGKTMRSRDDIETIDKQIAVQNKLIDQYKLEDKMKTNNEADRMLSVIADLETNCEKIAEQIPVTDLLKDIKHLKAEIAAVKANPVSMTQLDTKERSLEGLKEKVATLSEQAKKLAKTAPVVEEEDDEFKKAKKLLVKKIDLQIDKSNTLKGNEEQEETKNQLKQLKKKISDTKSIEDLHLPKQQYKKLFKEVQKQCEEVKFILSIGS